MHHKTSTFVLSQLEPYEQSDSMFVISKNSVVVLFIARL